MRKLSRYFSLLLLIMIACTNIEDIDELARYAVEHPDCPVITKAYYKDACLDTIIIEVEDSSLLCEAAHVVMLQEASTNRLEDRRIIKDAVGNDTIRVAGKKIIVTVENSNKKYKWVYLDFLHSCGGKDEILNDSFILPQFQVSDSRIITNIDDTLLDTLEPKGLVVDTLDTALYFVGTRTKKIYKANINYLDDIYLSNLETISGGNDWKYNTDCQDFARDGRFEKPIDLTIQSKDNLFIVDNGNTNGRVIRRINNFSNTQGRVIYNTIGNRKFTRLNPLDLSIESCSLSLISLDHIASSSNMLFFSDRSYGMIFSATTTNNNSCACSFDFRNMTFESNSLIVEQELQPSSTIRGLAVSSNETPYVLLESGIIQNIQSQEIIVNITDVSGAIIGNSSDLIIDKDDNVFFTTQNKNIGYFNLHYSPIDTIYFLKEKGNCSGRNFSLKGENHDLAIDDGAVQKTLYISTSRHEIECIKLY